MVNRDEFDDPEGFFSRLVTHTGQAAGSAFENRSLLISGAVFVVVVALSGVIWASYPSQHPLSGDAAVPIIRADAKPYKYVPAERGGMEIPHQDSTIFAAVRSQTADGKKVEDLLADDTSEQPVDRAGLFAGLKTDLADATNADGQKETKVAGIGDYQTERPLSETERRAEAARRNRERLNQAAEPLPGDANVNTKRLPSVLNQGEVKPEIDPAATTPTPPPETEKPVLEEARAPVTPAPATPAKTVAKATTAPTTTTTATKAAQITPAAGAAMGNAYVQVASVPSADKVAGEWGKLTSTLPMLAGKPYRVQAADIPGKGTYHRIQVGPMAKDAATNLCGAIKAKKPGGCLVAK